MANSVDNFPHPRHNWEIEYPEHQNFLLESNLGSNPRKNDQWLDVTIRACVWNTDSRVLLDNRRNPYSNTCSRVEKKMAKGGAEQDEGLTARFRVIRFSVISFVAYLRAIRVTISNNNLKENDKLPNQRGDPEPLCDRLTKEEENRPSYV